MACYCCRRSTLKRLLFCVAIIINFIHAHAINSDTRNINEVIPTKTAISSFATVAQSELGGNCTKNSHCNHVRFSHCNDGVCSCYPYHVRYNSSLCLPASLLGYGCLVGAQCQMKVPNSRCVDEVCICERGYTQLRKDKCLVGAKVGQFCATDEQCRLSSPESFCNFIIPRVYGRCACAAGLTTDQDKRCVPFLGSSCVSDMNCGKLVRNSRCSHAPLLSQSISSLSHLTPTEIRLTSQNNSQATTTTTTTTITPLTQKRIRFAPYNKHCICREGFRASDDRKRCAPIARRVASETPVSLGKYCENSDQCQSRDPHSLCLNNVCQCIAPTPQCNASNTGCHKDTFQCRNGECISWYFVCNGQFNCNDGSDELECIHGRCPKEAFQCLNGDCISKAKLCNGKKDCLDGSDELDCRGSCNTSLTFRCNDGACLPKYMFCNAVSSCRDKSDEDPAACELGKYCTDEHFRCKNGRCRSTAILCSGKNGCGDNSDEALCKVCDCPKI